VSGPGGGGPQDAVNVGRGEELLARHASELHAVEAVGIRLIAAQRGPQPQQLGRDGRQGRLPTGPLVAGQGGLVAPALVLGQRLVQRPVPVEPRVDRLGQQIRIAEGVGDPLRQQRVLVVAGAARRRTRRRTAGA
jgi:hypothetical protein